jgi:hypothetical protein
VPDDTSVAVNDVAALRVSNIATSVAKPADELASITYDVAASGDVGASHVNVTVLPLTDAVRFDGAPGAASAAAETASRDGAGQGASTTPTTNIPVPRVALCVRHLHEVMTGIAWAGVVTADSGPIGDDGDGRVGAWLPPQLVNVKRVATADPAVSARLM